MTNNIDLAHSIKSIKSQLKYKTKEISEGDLDTILKLVEHTFEGPLNFLDRKILEQDKYFHAYTDLPNVLEGDIPEKSHLNLKNCDTLFSDLMETFADDLQEVIPGTVDWSVVKIVQEYMKPSFYQKLLQLVTPQSLSILFADGSSDSTSSSVVVSPTNSDQQKVDAEKKLAESIWMEIDEIKQILSMSNLQRVLYFLIADFDIQGYLLMDVAVVLQILSTNSNFLTRNAVIQIVPTKTRRRIMMAPITLRYGTNMERRNSCACKRPSILI